MRKTLFGFALAVAALFTVAMTYPPVEQLLEGQMRINGELVLGGANTPVRFKGPVYLDNIATPDGGAGFSSSAKGTLVYDFPSLSGPNTALNTVCAESSAGTATGCKFGDTVLLGIDQVPVSAFGTVTAYVSAADSFKVRACATGITDGGSFDMPDASYTVRCLR